MAEQITTKAPAEDRVAIINLSTRQRKFQVTGFVKEDGKPGDVIEIVPNAGKAVEVPAKAAEFLLGKLSSGQPRYPELKDAASYVPPSANNKAKLDELVAQNKKLLEENADLKSQIKDISDEPVEKKKGWK